MKNFILKLDRWFLNNLFRKKRIFHVNLNDCIDEFGNSFGKDGNHFFVSALNFGVEKDKIIENLMQYYAKNKIKSVNEILKKDMGHLYGEMYFLPWERNRVRKLEKFLTSHKIGPTPDMAVIIITNRLIKIFKKIKFFGFHPYLFNSFPRVIKVQYKNSIKFIIRDGQHRLACLSHMGIKKIPVCYEADHWKPSLFFMKIHNFLKQKDVNFTHPKVFSIKYINDWPYVKSKIISKNDALKLFKYYYGNL